MKWFCVNMHTQIHAQIEEICHCCALQVLIPERQMSEGLLEVLSQRTDLFLFCSSLLVSVQSCRLASVYGLDCSELCFWIVLILHLSRNTTWLKKWRSLRALLCLLRQTAQSKNTSEERARSHWYHTNTQIYKALMVISGIKYIVSHTCVMDFVCVCVPRS